MSVGLAWLVFSAASRSTQEDLPTPLSVEVAELALFLLLSSTGEPRCVLLLNSEEHARQGVALSAEMVGSVTHAGQTWSGGLGVACPSLDHELPHRILFLAEEIAGGTRPQDIAQALSRPAHSTVLPRDQACQEASSEKLVSVYLGPCNLCL